MVEFKMSDDKKKMNAAIVTVSALICGVIIRLSRVRLETLKVM